MKEKRVLSLKDLVLSGLCIMAPLAPFTAYYQIADASFGMVGLVYLIGMIAMLFIANSFSQLSKAYPVSGSAYGYVQRGTNPHIGFIAGWANLSLYFFIPAFIMMVAGIWLSEIIPGVPMIVWLLLFTIINISVNIKGVGITSKLNNVVFWTQVGLIVTFIGLAAKSVFIDGKGLGGFSLTPIFQSSNFSIELIGVAISLAIFGFIGFDTIGALADEAKNPKKDIGRAATIAIMLAGTFFFLQTYMAGLVAPDYSSLNPDTALFDVAKMVGGETLFMALLILNIVAYGVLIPINIQAAIGRIVYNMSKDGLLPASKFFAKKSEKNGTPINALVTMGILSFIFSATLNFDLLMSATNICALVMFIILNYTVIKHLFFERKERGFKGLVFNLIIPIVGLIITLFLLTQFTSKAILLALGILFIGVVIGFVKSKGYKKEIKIEDI